MKGTFLHRHGCCACLLYVRRYVRIIASDNVSLFKRLFGPGSTSPALKRPVLALRANRQSIAANLIASILSNQGIRIIMGGLFLRSLLNSITTAGELAQDGEGGICCQFSWPFCHGCDKNRAFCHEMLLGNLHHWKKRLCNTGQASDHLLLAVFFQIHFLHRILKMYSTNQ